MRFYAGLLIGLLAVNAAGFTLSETLRRLGLQATVRLSFGIYSSREDLLAVREAIRQARKLFGSK